MRLLVAESDSAPNACANDVPAKPFVAQASTAKRNRADAGGEFSGDVFRFDDLVVNRASHQACRAGRLRH